MQRPYPQARTLPAIPEVKRQARPQSKPVVQKRVTRPTNPVVNKYPVNSKNPALSTPAETAAVRELQKKQALEKATVEIDPYASIPESANGVKNTAVAGSKPDSIEKAVSGNPAVVSLMKQARADMAIGQSQSAISKLERGLRIDSSNSNAWHLLAKAHYAQAEYQQSITMAKKSIRYARKDELIAENWRLIKKAGEKSGDTIAVKEALDYAKLNP